MNDIIVAALALLGTLGGSLAGVLAASRLTNYRIEQLERKVSKHNNLLERMSVAKERLKMTGLRLDALEKERCR